MKKRVLNGIALATLMLFLSAGFVFAADEAEKNFISNKVGVGYQGMVAGNFLNGLSVRGWIGDRIGLEASGFYGRGSAEIEAYGEKDEMKGDLWLIEAKAMYAFIVRNYSKFYAGGKFGYGQINASSGMMPYAEVIDGTTFFTPGLFVGSEWSFPQLPEVGFNFDVGYSWLIYNNKLNEDPYVYMNLNMNGISATFGIHYYF